MPSKLAISRVPVPTATQDLLIQDEGPPAYSYPSAVSPQPYFTNPYPYPHAHQAQPRSSPRMPGLPVLDFSKYLVPDCTVSADQSTLMTHQPALSTDAAALVSFIQQQAALPPRPEVRVRGQHREGDKGPLVTDFDIRLNMLRYLVPESSPPWNYMRLVEGDESTFRGGSPQAVIMPTDRRGSQGPEALEMWAKRFVEDKTTPRTFALHRIVANWDTEYIEGQIRSLVAATKYTGQLSVTFPVVNSKVVVHTPVKGNQFLSKIVSTVMGVKQYEVAFAVWPFATRAANARNDESQRVCAVQSEDIWWNQWRETIRYAIMSQKKGWVSLDDYMEAAMGGCPAIDKGKAWGS